MAGATTTTTSVASVHGAAAAAKGAVPPEVKRAAEEFESVFLSQILGQMGASFGVPSIGGGEGDGGENPFASMLRDEYAKVIGRSGGIGVADAVMRELLRAQEFGA